jgi:hypothetical protein
MLPTVPSGDLQRMTDPIAKYFQKLAHRAAPRVKAILDKADDAADSLGFDDTLLDSFLVKLKLG